MHLFSKISAGACPRTPPSKQRIWRYSWPCRMQELAWSGLSTPYFSFLGMPVHYMEQNLTCLLLLWLVFKSLMLHISSQTIPPPKNWAGYGPEQATVNVNLRVNNALAGRHEYTYIYTTRVPTKIPNTRLIFSGLNCYQRADKLFDIMRETDMNGQIDISEPKGIFNLIVLPDKTSISFHLLHLTCL